MARQSAGELQEKQNELFDGGTGIEVEDTSGAEISEPFNPALIRVETRPLIIDALLKRISHNEIDLAPGFQRKGGIWSLQAKSRLIESILIRIPLPAFYFDATDEDQWLVVDGLQRLTTLKLFVLDKTLRLEGLEFLTELNNRIFDELPRNFQRRIEETQITAYLIEKGTPPEVKFNIFKRINTGGLPLSPQEIRHALNPGPATKFLEQLSTQESFLKATGRSIKDTRMADREFALRFIAFAMTPYRAYSTREDLDTFLNRVMADVNQMADNARRNLKKRFNRAMNAAHDIFGPHAFRKQYNIYGPRFPINKALFEAWSANLDQLNDSQLKTAIDRRQLIIEKFVKLMSEDRAFEASVSQGTGDPSKVKKRFSSIERIIKEVLT